METINLNKNQKSILIHLLKSEINERESFLEENKSHFDGDEIKAHNENMNELHILLNTVKG